MRSKVVLFAFCLALFGCGQKGQMGMGGVPEYAVMTLQPTSSDLNSTYPAIIKGKQDIEIRPQVAGFITK
ncbi:MAG: efflux RND transporter periplasmic adaptor subunit, partial [Bacteroides sp.]